jgi:lipopolysaccharide export system permease protein
MRQLGVAIDSIEKVNKLMAGRVKTDVFGFLPFSRFLDSNWKGKATPVKARSFEQLIPDSIKALVHQKAGNRINSLKGSNEIILAQYEDLQRNLRQHQIEWHRKISLSVACLVLFLIGAPLGSIIRKGGLGSPLVFAIIFFMLFYFSSTTGEKFAKEGSMDPRIGMWMSTFFLVPIGIFLTYKAMRDSQLFSKEFYNRISRKIKALREKN